MLASQGIDDLNRVVLAQDDEPQLLVGISGNINQFRDSGIGFKRWGLVRRGLSARHFVG